MLPPVDPRDQLTPAEMSRALMYASTPAGLLDLLRRVVELHDIAGLAPATHAFVVEMTLVLDTYEGAVKAAIAAAIV